MKLCLCFSLFFSYPLMLIPAALSLERRAEAAAALILGGKPQSPQSPQRLWWAPAALRAALVAATAAPVIVLPGIAELLVRHIHKN